MGETEPAAAYLKEEAKAHPLVILDVFLVSIIPGLIHPWMWHVDPHPLPVGGGEGVGGVDPTVGVEHILGNLFGVHAHDGGPDVLPCGHDEGEG